MQQKIVLIGGPGTGKTTIINHLSNLGFECMHEISREVTSMAKKQGIEQLFLTDPLLFSKMLLEGREQQYLQAEQSESELIFFDRGIPDVHAYLNYLGITYPNLYEDKSKKYVYDKIFLMPPWETIYITDNERYESFEQSLAIHNHLKKSYSELDYTIMEVPFGTIEERTNFILENLK